MDVLPFFQPQTIDASPPRRAHLVGIAGNGMRALADVLLGWEWTVSGSDLARISHRRVPLLGTSGAGAAGYVRHCLFQAVAHCSPISPYGEKCGLDIAPLPQRGLRVFQGHAAEHLSPETELVVYSDAVPSANPELRRAAELGIPTLSYFQTLGRLCIGRRTLAVAGTHGKSTAAAMLAHLLVQAGLDPTVVYGAAPLGGSSGGRAGGRPLLVVEACEYRANFLHLRPWQAAILGIEPDHFDCYDSLGQLENAFRRFAESVPNDGLLVVRHDCQSTRRVTAGLGCRVESFGFSADADWSARTLEEDCGRFRFEIHRHGRPLCEVQLPTPGEHNVLNALAAAALAHANGLSPEQISAGLGSFPGLRRRLESLGQWRGVTLIDDYAHHPTEVTAALAAVRRMVPGARVWCVFQPHQASRTARLFEQFAASLQNADKLLVADIFRAREGDPQPGEVTAADLARRAAQLGVEVLPAHAARDIVETLETQLAPGDVLVTLGAGDVGKLRPRGLPEDSSWV
jgi:UDP-N-acetylmuramate--alanine ligase